MESGLSKGDSDMTKQFAFSTLLLAFAIACTSTTPGERSEPIIDGHFGDIEDFSSAPELNEAYFWGDTTYLDVRGQGSDWALMAALTLNGRLGEGDLAPGSVVHVEGYSWEDFPAATMLGCSGPVPDEWWTDCSPDDIVVQIHDGTEDDSVIVDFVATFPEDCGGIVGPPGTEPGWPGEPPPPGTEPGEPPPGGSDPGEPTEPPPPGGSEPGEPPPGAEPGEPPPGGSDPGEPPPAGEVPVPADYASSGAAQVIRGVIEVRLADIIEDGGDGWGGPVEPAVIETADY